jgi:hypothetical protein
VLSLQLIGYLIKEVPYNLELPQSCFVVRTWNKPPFALQVKSTESELSCVVSTMLGISSSREKINSLVLKIKLSKAKKKCK